jgi:hypothetical protein
MKVVLKITQRGPEEKELIRRVGGLLLVFQR